MQDQLQLIWSNLSALGARRLISLAAAAILIIVSIALGAKYVNKPAFETLYVGLERVDILHGKGTGALRLAVQQHLRGHSQVARAEEAPWNQGGAGVTVVHLL